MPVCSTRSATACSPPCIRGNIAWDSRGSIWRRGASRYPKCRRPKSPRHWNAWTSRSCCCRRAPHRRSPKVPLRRVRCRHGSSTPPRRRARSRNTSGRAISPRLASMTAILPSAPQARCSATRRRRSSRRSRTSGSSKSRSRASICCSMPRRDAISRSPKRCAASRRRRSCHCSMAAGRRRGAGCSGIGSRIRCARRTPRRRDTARSHNGSRIRRRGAR